MTTFDLLVQQVINGLSLGAMYALLALGFTLIIGDEIRREEAADLLFIPGVKCRSPILDRGADLFLGLCDGLGCSRSDRNSKDDGCGG